MIRAQRAEPRAEFFQLAQEHSASRLAGPNGGHTPAWHVPSQDRIAPALHALFRPFDAKTLVTVAFCTPGEDHPVRMTPADDEIDERGGYRADARHHQRCHAVTVRGFDRSPKTATVNHYPFRSGQFCRRRQGLLAERTHGKSGQIDSRI
jgi:hypothetical protein